MADERKILNLAHQLITQQQYHQARNVLKQIPRNKTAQQWIAEINRRIGPETSAGLSPAQLLLLSKFLSPHTIDLYETEAWVNALKESPREVLRQFYNTGLLMRPSVEDKLNASHGVSALKELLRERNLPVSGKKADLLKRLLETDPNGMAKVVESDGTLICSEQGRALAEGYIAHEKAKREAVDQAVMKALHQHNFREACQLVAIYQSEQVFSQGLNIDWSNRDGSYESDILERLFAHKPDILAKVDGVALEQLRIASAMSFLWGARDAEDWLPEGFDAQLPYIDNNAAARMLFFYAKFLYDLKRYRSIGVKKVKFNTVNDDMDCTYCKTNKGKVFSISKPPALFNRDCDCEMGCRSFLRPADS